MVKVRAVLAALLVLVGATLYSAPTATGVPPGRQVPSADDCKVMPGLKNSDPWAQQRLDVQRVWQITRGRNVDTGERIRVAVIDSGLSRLHPQFAGQAFGTYRDAIVPDPLRAFNDCGGHGTQVTALIAAKFVAGVRFYGVAPDVEILPIKQSDGHNGRLVDLVRAIRIAVADKAQIINMSVGVGADDPSLRAAVESAAAHHILIVAAAGNDDEQGRNLPQWPAGYANSMRNVIAVSATARGDTFSNASVHQSYVTLAAPGERVWTVAVRGGYYEVTGTSFATPLVTGTAALVLAAHPTMTPEQIRARLTATADRPAMQVPNEYFGWGIVNPYLAVTSVSDDSAPVQTAAPKQPLVPRAAAEPPDRHLQHVALAAAAAMLGLLVLAITAAAILRGRLTRRPASTR